MVPDGNDRNSAQCSDLFFAAMRRTALLVVIAFAFLGAHALAQPTVSVRGNVGAAFFRSPAGLNVLLNSGVDFGVEASVQVYRGLELKVGGSYDRFTFNEDNVALYNPELDYETGSTLEAGNYNFLNVGVGLRYVFTNESDAHPYLASGMGYYRSTIAQSQSVREGQTTSTGMHVGAGVEFRIDETYSVFFEPRYVIVYADSEELSLGTSSRFVPVRLGLEMNL